MPKSRVGQERGRGAAARTAEAKPGAKAGRTQTDGTSLESGADTSAGGAEAGSKRPAGPSASAGSSAPAPRAANRPEGAPKPERGRSRVVVENLKPRVDCGRFPAKRVCGDIVVVEADVFGDGHDLVRARLLYRHSAETEWRSVEMAPLGNDHWQAEFPVSQLGFYYYTVVGDVDHFLTWRTDLKKRADAGQELDIHFLTGANMIDRTVERVEGRDADALRKFSRRLREKGSLDVAFDPELLTLMHHYPDAALETRYERELAIWVDRERARFSAWYELFPRSWGKLGEHGTLRDVADRLGYVEEMGFDVLYLPPIHPIGESFRKGRNNTTEAEPGDVGSPWAIGGREGGHTAIHPQLGTFADFDYLVQRCRKHGLELAMDIAFQCAPDHPWVAEHPEWFKKRADGSIQYAENPPKKYQDIYPLDFESEDWRGLWDGLRDVFLFWAERGVRIFRVDNPHTKAFPFWEWCLAEVKRVYPDAIFLAEAFTRPRVMERLAKLGYTQSYTYFTWRTTKDELTQYMTELTRTSVCEYMRPNFWPNTPDILPLELQSGGLPAFRSRVVLAATLSSNYGMYGPAFELGENAPFKPGGEEYLRSEKYEIKQWDLDAPHSLKPLITRLNHARRENPALQSNERLVFHWSENPQLIVYSKCTADRENMILCVVCLDAANAQSGWIGLNLGELGIGETEGYDVYDLLADRSFAWRGSRNYVELRPWETPAHVFEIRRR
jgi:starch synthase (maltosyl-transferring)